MVGFADPTWPIVWNPAKKRLVPHASLRRPAITEGFVGGGHGHGHGLTFSVRRWGSDAPEPPFSAPSPSPTWRGRPSALSPPSTTLTSPQRSYLFLFFFLIQFSVSFSSGMVGDLVVLILVIRRSLRSTELCSRLPPLLGRLRRHGLVTLILESWNIDAIVFTFLTVVEHKIFLMLVIIKKDRFYASL